MRLFFQRTLCPHLASTPFLRPSIQSIECFTWNALWKVTKKKNETHTHTNTLNRRISHSEAVFIYLQYKFSGYIPSNRVRYYSPVRCGADTFQCVLFYIFFILCRLSTVGKSQVKLVKIITKSIPQPVQSLFETTSVFRCSFVSFEIHRYWWRAGGLCMLILKWSPWTWTVIVAYTRCLCVYKELTNNWLSGILWADEVMDGKGGGGGFSWNAYFVKYNRKWAINNDNTKQLCIFV